MAYGERSGRDVVDKMLPITVVSATRYDQRDFYLQSALGRSLSQIFSNFPVKRKIYFSNVKPLPVWFSSPAATFSVLSSILLHIKCPAAATACAVQRGMKTPLVFEV
jgi:hypothetical protein